LINGLAQNARHWNPHLLDALCGRDWVDDVTTMDLPGAGVMSGYRSPTRIPEYVSLMRQFYHRELATDGPRMLVALSLGGMVAGEWCAQYPNDFQKLVLINTSFGQLAASHKRLQPAAWITFAKVFFGRNRLAREQRTLDLVSNHPDRRQAILHHWVEARRAHPMTQANAIRQLYAAKSYTAPSRLPADTVVVCSRHDRLCHYTASERIAEHYRVKLVVDPTPTIGHAFHVDAAEELAAIIDRCVEERVASTRGEADIVGRD
jgi:pimeloyl-ACP methyl ester carboxylesterase